MRYFGESIKKLETNKKFSVVRLFHTIASYGTQETKDYKILRTVLVLNYLSLFCISFTLFFAGVFFFTGQADRILNTIPPLLMLSAVIYFNKINKINLSRLTLVIGCSAALFYACYKLGYSSNIPLFYTSAMVLTFLIFSGREKVHIVFFSCINIVLFFICFHLRDSFMIGTTPLPENVRNWVSYLFLFGNMLLLALVSYTLAALVEKYQLRLLKDESENIDRSKKASLAIMSAGIAHEVNNPLAIIYARSDQLSHLAKLGRLDQASITKGLDNIKKNVERISAIVKSLRYFARDTSDDPLEPHSLKRIIDESLVLSSDQIFTNRVAVSIEGDHDNIIVECNPSQLMQVMFNLLSNSCDAVAKLSEKWIKIKIVDDEGIAKILVIDSGQGIDEAVRKSIMQPFFTTKDVGQGTGLGLSLASTIIERHHGKLYLDSYHENTCFIIELPKLEFNKKMQN
ncbi:MAG: GHKL domain-containing protein [Oligoflexales bacterium]|nr:GHKL domain-containing protein [Oligoflexales bacterium]